VTTLSRRNFGEPLSLMLMATLIADEFGFNHARWKTARRC
jgi:hypothetical protein